MNFLYFRHSHAGSVSLAGVRERYFPPDDKAALLLQQTEHDGKYKCAVCEQYFFADELTVDHITPWSKGGRTVLSNAQLLCRPCNSKKGNR